MDDELQKYFAKASELQDAKPVFNEDKILEIIETKTMTKNVKNFSKQYNLRYGMAFTGLILTSIIAFTLFNNNPKQDKITTNEQVVSKIEDKNKTELSKKDDDAKVLIIINKQDKDTITNKTTDGLGDSLREFRSKSSNAIVFIITKTSRISMLGSISQQIPPFW